MRSARRFITAWLGLALLLSGCASPTTPAPSATPIAVAPDAATVSELAGTVEGRPSEAEPLAPIAIGFEIRTGGQVQTGEASRARLDFSDRSILRLGANSLYTLQRIEPGSDGNVAARIQLAFGKVWVSLLGGTLEVETPLGVASVRGSYAIFQYAPGDPDDPNDDLLLIDCLEGACAALSATVNERLGNLERLVLGRQAFLRQLLTEDDVRLFLQANPESTGLIAALTAAPPATATPTRRASPTATNTQTRTPLASTSTASATSAPAPSATFTASPAALLVTVTSSAPRVHLLGTHVVQRGETLFCIGRGYGVLPAAIAVINHLPLAEVLQPGARLSIPAVQWEAIPPGPSCAPQVASPFPALPPSTATPTPPINLATLTPVAICLPNEFFDPVMRVCRPVVAPPTATPAPAATATLSPPTATNTLVPTPDTFGPGITNLSTNPTMLGATFGCAIIFSADLSDPAGVSAATASWIATSVSGQSNSGSVSLAPVSGTQWSSSSVTIGVPGPYYGTLTWGVAATDTLSNGSTANSVTPVTVQFPGCL